MKLLYTFLTVCLLHTSLSYSCVTVDPGTGKYQVDNRGCVEKTQKHKPMKKR